MGQQQSLVYNDKTRASSDKDDPGKKFVSENEGVKRILANEDRPRSPAEKKAIGRELRKAADKIDPPAGPAPAPPSRDPKKT